MQPRNSLEAHKKLSLSLGWDNSTLDSEKGNLGVRYNILNI